MTYMMNLNKSILATLLVSALLCACDEVDNADRYEQLPDIQSQRVVLLEEFTGQLCTNCPDAHRLVANLHEQYGEQLISVAIHAGSFGIGEGTNPNMAGLMQPDGNTYADYWKVSAYPSGVVNRRSGVLNSSAWATSIREELKRAAKLNIRLSATASEDGSISISTHMEPSSDVSGKLQLWITESGIQAIQIDNGKMIADYVHNHVYRASVNGTWGEDIALKANIFKDTEHTVQMKDNWVKENLSVVAFVYNDAEGVMQVAECEVE